MSAIGEVRAEDSISRRQARREAELWITVVVSKRDGAFLHDVADDGGVSVARLFRAAMDAYLRSRGLPRLERHIRKDRI